MSSWDDKDDFLARWLSDELSPEEKTEFEGSEAGREYLRMIQAADRLSAPAYDTQYELSKLKTRIGNASSTPAPKVIWMRPVFRYAVAASITALIVLSYLLFRPSLTTVRTSPGQQEIVVLPDGSEVQLNAASSISYNKKTWDEQRELQLTGEAFFQVEKGSRFVVNTEYGDVTVLGTSFNVKTRQSKLEVICYTGKVNVSSENSSQDLLPGDAIRIEQGRIINSWRNENSQQPGWMSGQTFYDEPVPLAEAIEEISNIFGIQIVEENYPDSLQFRGPIPHRSASSAIQLVLDAHRSLVAYEYDSASRTLRVFEKSR